MGPKPIFLAGPTASGKSAVALELAGMVDGEILAADSMQVYRGLDIGTAKPTSADRLRIPHHLLDLVEPDEAFDAARWLECAREACHQVRSRGRTPIFCGGTGLYFQLWFGGLEAVPPSDPELRRELESRPLAELLAELAAADPETHGRIDRRNARRVVRALEIIRLTGRPVVRRSVSTAGVPDASVTVLRRDPGDLRARIHSRIRAMFAAGWVEETRGLLARGLERNRTAMQAIGYREIVEHLGGRSDPASTLAAIESRTWQYARRQVTWFRHQLPVTWLEVPEAEDPGTTARRIAATR